MTTEVTHVHLLRDMYLLLIGGTCNTHRCTLASTFTHALGERRVRERLSMQGIQAMCGLCADTAWYNRTI